MKKKIISSLIAVASIFTFCISAGAFAENDYDYDSGTWYSDYSSDYYYSGSTSSGSSLDWNDVLDAYDDYNSNHDYSQDNNTSTEYGGDYTFAGSSDTESSDSFSFLEFLRLLISIIFNLFT